TGWYIKQLGSVEPMVRTGYTDEQADALTPWRCSEDSEIDLGWFSVHLKRGQILRVQDRGVLNIIRANRWERPIYFAITVSPGNKLGLENHLKMESMVLRLVKEKGSNMIDLQRSRDLIMNHHIYRGLNDETIYKNENTKKLLTNYAATFSAVGQAYCNQGKFEEARLVLEKGVEVLYPFWGIYQVLARAYDGLGKLEKGLEIGEKALATAREDEKAIIYANLLPLYQKSGKMEELKSLLIRSTEENPGEFSGFWALFRVYHTQGNSVAAAEVLERWLMFHPQDNDTRKFWAKYVRESEPQKITAQEQ
ncbi:hypothetical protein KAU04_04225, partial [bacterium]|nr:hypothetical protein [bacterium]